jgi:peptidyl-dipeptidase A
MDASAVLEYFAPLQTWLKQQNEGKSCGWQASAAAPATAAPASSPAPAAPPPKPAG